MAEAGPVLREHYPDMPALLAAVRKRPGMFLGHQTVCGLHLLLSGIWFAEDFHGVPLADRIAGFDAAGFERWVQAGPGCAPAPPARLSRCTAMTAAGRPEAPKWTPKSQGAGGRPPQGGAAGDRPGDG